LAHVAPGRFAKKRPRLRQRQLRSSLIVRPGVHQSPAGSGSRTGLWGPRPDPGMSTRLSLSREVTFAPPSSHTNDFD
uniref:Uncharacterized protein n=1 Tax=Schistocephalus solidus TaxID=70667 RepID=A0A183SCF8_SCHSO